MDTVGLIVYLSTFFGGSAIALMIHPGWLPRRCQHRGLFVVLCVDYSRTTAIKRRQQAGGKGDEGGWEFTSTHLLTLIPLLAAALLLGAWYAVGLATALLFGYYVAWSSSRTRNASSEPSTPRAIQGTYDAAEDPRARPYADRSDNRGGRSRKRMERG